MKTFSTGDAFRFRGRRRLGLRGFDGKPLHAPLTDLPIGAYMIAAGFDIAAMFGHGRPWASDLHVAAGWVLIVGLAFSVLTIVTGLADIGGLQPGSEGRQIANLHALAMTSVTLLVIVNLMVRAAMPFAESRVALGILGLVLIVGVAIGGMLGGELVYDRGYRVRQRAGDESVREVDLREPVGGGTRRGG